MCFYADPDMSIHMSMSIIKKSMLEFLGDLIPEQKMMLFPS